MCYDSFTPLYCQKTTKHGSKVIREKVNIENHLKIFGPMGPRKDFNGKEMWINSRVVIKIEDMRTSFYAASKDPM